jgi:acid phosphatase family membrane protein YuiD
MAALWRNTALWLPILVAVVIQLYKLIAFWGRPRRLDLRVLAQAGGMPSSHSGMVTSLVTAIGYEYGLDSGSVCRWRWRWRSS